MSIWVLTPLTLGRRGGVKQEMSSRGNERREQLWLQCKGDPCQGFQHCRRLGRTVASERGTRRRSWLEKSKVPFDISVIFPNCYTPLNK